LDASSDHTLVSVHVTFCSMLVVEYRKSALPTLVKSKFKYLKKLGW